MNKKIHLTCMLALVLTTIAGVAAAFPVISFSPSSVTLVPDGSTDVDLILSEAPDGLAGYQFNIVFSPAVAKVSDASFPSWATLNKGTAGTSTFTVSGIDLNNQIEAGVTNVRLATLTVVGVGSGTGAMSLTNLQIDSDADTQFSPSLGTLQVTVMGGGSTTTATTTTTSTTTATTTAAVIETTAPIVTATTGVMPGAPLAGFTAMPVSGNAPLKIQFYDRSTNSPTSFEWDFGDGGSSMIQNPSYTYTSDGLYTVRLKASNSKGSTTAVQTEYIAVGNLAMIQQAAKAATPAATPAGTELAPSPQISGAVTDEVTQMIVMTTGREAAAGVIAPVAGIVLVAAISVLLIRKGKT